MMRRMGVVLMRRIIIFMKNNGKLVDNWNYFVDFFVSFKVLWTYKFQDFFVIYEIIRARYKTEWIIKCLK
jgi:hypothetical protein